MRRVKGRRLLINERCSGMEGTIWWRGERERSDERKGFEGWVGLFYA